MQLQAFTRLLMNDRPAIVPRRMESAIVATGIVAAGVCGIGLVPLLARRPGFHAAGIGFAAGTLLTMVLLHVLPEALELSEHAALFFLAGFVVMMTVQQKVLKADPCCGHDHSNYAGIPSFLALALCSLNDGVILSSDVSEGLASHLFWAMAFHKALTAFALVVFLREVGALKRSWMTALYLGGFLLVTPIALVLATQLESAAPWRGFLLGIASGALLYVIASSFVPRVEHMAQEHSTPVFLVFLVAVVANAGIHIAMAHEHGS